MRNVLADLGAAVVALAPAQHDALVAVVSHVPHLTAATLMDLAAGLGQEHAALLQLAAGGFRDMTRIAAGQPSIWPDICEDNAEAIVATLDLLIEALDAMRRRVADHDHDSLLEILSRAADARRVLSDRGPLPEELVEVRIPLLDRTGALAEVTVLAAELGINILDLEIAHSVAGNRRCWCWWWTPCRPRPCWPPSSTAATGPRAHRSGPPGERRTATGDGPGARHPGGSGRDAAHRVGAGARGQVHLPPGPAVGGAGRGGLDHHRPVRRRRRGPDAGGGLALGAGVSSDADTVTVVGGRSRLAPPGNPVDLGNSGTAMRLLAGVAATLVGTTTLTGDDSLRGRPMDRVAEPLTRMGAEVTGLGERSLPPLTVTGGPLTGITYTPPWPAPR